MTHQKLGRGAAIAAIGLSTVFVAAGCSASTPSDDVAPSVNPTAAVTITVGNMPTADQAENLKAFKDQVAAFEELHPNITVEGDETRFDVSTFNSLLVGDTLPTTMIVPRTNIQQLVQNEQVKDITPFIQDDELLSQQNPVLTEATTGTDGDVYGVTTSAYTMGLVYNRAIYEAAGLDPDNPPTTWEEVRQNAVTIAQATGDTGFIIPTSNNGGGWVTTAISNAFGGTVETVDGDDVTVTADNDGTQSALGFLNDIRWTDNAAGSTFLLKYGDVLQAMGA
ncbi:MAG TPA: extracellular solute-binding protein, partial [Mycobacterium sp.]